MTEHSQGGADASGRGTGRRTGGIGGHHSPRMGKDEWLTPPHILGALGRFNLDPCSPIDRPWPTADQHYTKIDNGLLKPWYGRVWCNPPYGREAGKWLARMASHGRGTALIYARTETDDFFTQVWAKATALLFLRGRLFFLHVDGTVAKHNSGGPSVLVAYGQDDAKILGKCGLPGRYIE